MLFPQFRQADAGVQRQLEDEASQLVGRRVRDFTGRTHEEVRVVLESGSPNAGILRVAEETRAGVLVVGPGGVAERVVRHASCAVLIARRSGPGVVLAATDFSDPSLPAVAAGAAEAARRGVEFAVLHSVDLTPAAATPALGAYPALAVLSAVDSAAVRDSTLARLRECLDRLEVVGTPISAEGPAARAILETARTSPAELVVWARWGGRASRTWPSAALRKPSCRAAPCSTLVVRLRFA